MGISRYWHWSAGILVAVLGACSSPQGVQPNMVAPGPRDDAGGDPTQACGETAKTTMGPQGEILVWNTANTLFVRLSGVSPYQLTESHAYAGTATPGGWWSYPAKAVHDPYVDTFTYAFPLADLGANPGDNLHVAGHAFLLSPSYRFAEGQGQVEYTVQACENTPPPPGRVKSYV
ncbi:hypothetical protein [Thermus thermophilus]|uniref:hypothetical protein n=1 Tax=Thermus thermophilus TaxID=274 RepID=UPI001FAF2E95